MFVSKAYSSTEESSSTRKEILLKGSLQSKPTRSISPTIQAFQENNMLFLTFNNVSGNFTVKVTNNENETVLEQEITVPGTAEQIIPFVYNDLDSYLLEITGTDNDGYLYGNF